MEIPISPNTDGSVNSKSRGEATTEELATLRILRSEERRVGKECAI